MRRLIDNPYWTALVTEQQHFALGTGLARRFPPDVIPFAGVAKVSAESMRDLRDLLAPGESVYVGETHVADAASGGVGISEAIRQANCGLVHVGDHPGQQMHHTGVLPEQTGMAEPQVETLTSTNADEMVALTDVAFPGFFRRRTCELGVYVGLRERGMLVAMAGERLHVPGYTEISAVCTHPAYLRRGYAARLVTHMLRLHRERGVHSVLHVLGTNTGAIALYERLGFRHSGEVLFQLIRRTE